MPITPCLPPDISDIILSCTPLSTVTLFANNPAFSVFMTFNASLIPGFITPIIGKSKQGCALSKTTAEDVLQAKTTALTFWDFKYFKISKTKSLI